MRALLIRDHYPFNREQIWLPMDLQKVAAQLDASGVKTDVVDLNLSRLENINLSHYDRIGIGIIGAPYVPRTMDLARKIKERTGRAPLIGGQMMETLPQLHFRQIFGESAVQITTEQEKAQAFERTTMPPVYHVSVAGRIREMPSDEAKKYFENEFSFFVSQGCKYGCKFCAAKKKMPEQFSQTVKDDLEAICERAQENGIGRIEMYLSSLDLFQNPDKFKDVLKVFAGAREKYGIDVRIRGLSRIDSFLRAMKNKPEFRKLIPAAGLYCIGFGVDGTTVEVWKSQHKGNWSLADSDQALKLCKELKVTPEALIVLGYHSNSGYEGDNAESLKKDAGYAIESAKRFGAVARPYVAKDCAPGNDGWVEPRWSGQVSHILNNPILFKNLDYAALASDVTHPDPGFRGRVNEAYMKIIDMLRKDGLCATVPVAPYKDGSGAFDKEWNEASDKFNALVPFDR